MSKLFATLIIGFSLCTYFSNAQKSTTKKSAHKDANLRNEKVRIIADKIVSDGQVTTYLDNVFVTTWKLKAKRAQKAIYDRRTNKITIWGCKELVSKYKTIGTSTGVTEDRVEYVLGSGLVRVF